MLESFLGRNALRLMEKQLDEDKKGREQEKIPRYENTDDAKRRLKHSLSGLCPNALDTYTCKQFVFTTNEVSTYCQEDVDSLSLLTQMMQWGSSIRERRFRFHHLSWHEFLSAARLSVLEDFPASLQRSGVQNIPGFSGGL